MIILSSIGRYSLWIKDKCRMGSNIVLFSKKKKDVFIFLRKKKCGKEQKADAGKSRHIKTSSEKAGGNQEEVDII